MNNRLLEGEIWIINDEDPEKIGQGFETCAVLKKSSKGKWFVLEVDEGFKSSDKMLQSLVDAYNQEKNWLQLEELAKQNEYEELLMSNRILNLFSFNVFFHKHV